jgi:hypothetical protein
MPRALGQGISGRRGTSKILVDRDPAVTGTEVRKVVSLYDAISRALRERRPIPLPPSGY